MVCQLSISVGFVEAFSAKEAIQIEMDRIRVLALSSESVQRP
jgi:hypothetical protein